MVTRDSARPAIVPRPRIGVVGVSHDHQRGMILAVDNGGSRSVLMRHLKTTARSTR